jgi:hypothetical protein
MSRVRPDSTSKVVTGVVHSMRRAELDDELSKILRSRRRAPLRARRASTQEITVADDKSKTGNPDRQRINTSQEHEVRDWAKKFGVSEDMLRTAVTQVGNQATDVERYLKDNAKR